MTIRYWISSRLSKTVARRVLYSANGVTTRKLPAGIRPPSLGTSSVRRFGGEGLVGCIANRRISAVVWGRMGKLTGRGVSTCPRGRQQDVHLNEQGDKAERGGRIAAVVVEADA